MLTSDLHNCTCLILLEDSSLLPPEDRSMVTYDVPGERSWVDGTLL
jgi:hypothetical protein